VPETQFQDSDLELYKKLTKDTNYIGLLIYQHLRVEDCPFATDFQCKSTSSSGKNRERSEGKKYNENRLVYKNSMDSGFRYACQGGKTFLIHNGGSYDKYSIMYDFSVISLFSDFRWIKGNQGSILYIPPFKHLPPILKQVDEIDIIPQEKKQVFLQQVKGKKNNITYKDTRKTPEPYECKRTNLENVISLLDFIRKSEPEG
jgi:hypothetical protein